MFRFAAPKWSPVELQYLKEHIDDPVMQLACALAKSVNAIKNKTKEIVTGIVPTKKRSSKNTKIGKRSDLGLFLRSGWEADYMRYLNYTTIGIIQYESQTFSFAEYGIKHGTMGYTPDFKISNLVNSSSDYYRWVEVKGFLKAEDKTKLNRFKKYFPEEFARLEVVCGGPKTATYKFFEKLGVKKITNFLELKKTWKDIIPNWETV